MADRDYIPNTMFKIEPLNADNWLGWKQCVMALFQDRDLDGYVDGTIPRPVQVGTTVDPTIAAEQLAWDKKDKSAQNCIRLTVGDTNMAHILGASTAKQMWDQCHNCGLDHRPASIPDQTVPWSLRITVYSSGDPPQSSPRLRSSWPRNLGGPLMK